MNDQSYFSNCTKNRMVVLVTALLVAACSGGGSGGNTASLTADTQMASGMASKGPLNGSTVCAYGITGAAIQGPQIGICSNTTPTGHFIIDLGVYRGPVLFKAMGGNYVDEATGQTVALTVPLNSLLPNAMGGPVSVAITGLTELAYQQANAQAGRLSSANIQSALTNVQNNFGIPDIVGTMPVDALNLPASATDAQKNYALSLATLSQYVNNQPGTSLASGLQTLQGCLAAPSTGCGTGTTSVGSLLNTAMTTFVSKNTGFAGLAGSTGRVVFFGSVTALPGNGADGATGAAGTTGTTGQTGQTGSTGPTGSTGTAGATGSAGTSGATGPTGTTGAAGVAGATGATGAAGSTGAPGSAGVTGAAGPTGAAGNNGANGTNGAIGPAGPGVTWVNVTGTTQQTAANTGYMANNPARVSITLPVSSAVTLGDVIQINGFGAGGWTVIQNAGQSAITKSIRGSSSATTTGPISGAQYDAIELQYVGNNTFSVLNFAGSVSALSAGYIVQGGLTWMPSSSSIYKYAPANVLCSSAINGLTDWRLPTQAELMALFNSGAMNGQGWSLNSTWSSSVSGPFSHYSANLFISSFVSDPDTNSLYVTCVR